ncbi:glycosyltransferase family 25 protein [Sclerotinia borealis F-4128]|uniref:Glycosyltransferase family 25 protein n=1 Tax=Sclerotinia borealis (strain F-4128) TaxID=1432307 RepID=W9CHR9_SCLBF|nr:glycosyltransferase family 25 protein [Sclerotinia borealis F-4128]
MIQFRAFPFTILCISILLFIVFLNTSTPSYLTHYSSNLLQKSRPAHGSSDVANSTLGFQRIFAVGLPERSDKRDALTLTSSLTGFKIEWVDGVKGETVTDKAVPYGADRAKLWESNLGSWRGHMNAVRKIVEENLTSAMILEDDMDWDTRLKTQLLTFAAGSQFIQYPSSTPAHLISPYGDNWDLLWLGHCGEVFPETLDEYKSLPPSTPEIAHLSRKYIITSDPTVAPPHTSKASKTPPKTHIRDGQQGARKVLWDLSVDKLAGPFDNALAGLCRWGRDRKRLGMRCVSVTPALFQHHKAKGWVGGDSDIQKVGGEKGEVREKGMTENLVWSARMNVRELLMGEKIRGQWEDEDVV